jgi:hypothetical protein
VPPSLHTDPPRWCTPNHARLRSRECHRRLIRQPPDRWLVDLSSDAEILLPAQAYPDVALPEDRLFVPAEYVPLWESHGWKRG